MVDTDPLAGNIDQVSANTAADIEQKPGFQALQIPAIRCLDIEQVLPAAPLGSDQPFGVLLPGR